MSQQSPEFEDKPNRVETHYSISRSTMHVPGILQVPIAGPIGTACRFPRIHAPYEVEVVNWTATADGGPPVVPSPYGPECTTGLNSNLVFLGSQISGVVPVVIGGTSSGHSFSMSGTYYYGAKECATPVRNYSLGGYPWETGVEDEPGETPMKTKDKEDDYFPGENFSDGILDPTVQLPPKPPDSSDPHRGP